MSDTSVRCSPSDKFTKFTFHQPFSALVDVHLLLLSGYFLYCTASKLQVQQFRARAIPGEGGGGERRVTAVVRGDGEASDIGFLLPSTRGVEVTSRSPINDYPIRIIYGASSLKFCVQHAAAKAFLLGRIHTATLSKKSTFYYKTFSKE